MYELSEEIIYDDTIEYYEKQNATFITTSTTTNANYAPIESLGLLVNRTSSAALAEIKSYNSRILAHFNGNPATTTIIHYVPVESTTAAIDRFEHLSDITLIVPKHNVLLLIGAYNAHTGPEDALYIFHD